MHKIINPFIITNFVGLIIWIFHGPPWPMNEYLAFVSGAFMYPLVFWIFYREDFDELTKE